MFYLLLHVVRLDIVGGKVHLGTFRQCGTEEDDSSTVAPKSLGKANKDVSDFTVSFSEAAAARWKIRSSF